jgi:2-oxoisovalerate dehydrogenase E1 component
MKTVAVSAAPRDDPMVFEPPFQGGQPRPPTHQHLFEKEKITHFQKLARIRAFESELLTLFSQGKLNGTTHTCIGQEAVALTVMAALDGERDCVFSNHRGHGHFLCYGGSMEGLLSEIMGKEGAVCAGLGGSQHLHDRNYYSNGIQGGIAPVTAGIGLAEKVKGTGAVACCFLGDGTLGEGVVYETLNIASLWDLPLLFVLEHNHWAQSTPTDTTIAGGIEARARAFGIDVSTLKIRDIGAAIDHLRDVVATIRRSNRPYVQVFDTYRLAAHSKGDDHRSLDELACKRREDPYEILRQELGPAVEAIEANARDGVRRLVECIAARPDATLPEDLVSAYAAPARGTAVRDSVLVQREQAGQRQVTELNAALHELMAEDERVCLLGEDVMDPYGGAFKVTKGLSTRFPGRVRNTPISEALLAGMCIGMAMRGLRPVCEIMFGDFIGLCYDQLLNNASKFPYMFGGQVKVPLCLRTPMGGRRGYGPTHSQSLESLLLNVPGISLVCLSVRHNPRTLLRRAVLEDLRPKLFIETKVDYGRELGRPLPPGYRIDVIEPDSLYPALALRPQDGQADLTMVTYGGMVPEMEEALTRLQLQSEMQAELLIVSDIASPPWGAIEDSARRTGRLLTAEEGVGTCGFGSMVCGQLFERLDGARVRCRRLAAPNHPIPASKHLEMKHLPTAEAVERLALQLCGGGR